MKVKLLHHTPLWVCAYAIRTAWQSYGKSDTEEIEVCPQCNSEDRTSYWCANYINEEDTELQICEDCGYIYDYPLKRKKTGQKDKELIERVGNKFKHGSTLEHLVYSFKIEGISRALLQELARHRMASLTVKSTRYTLKELKDEEFAIAYNPLTYNKEAFEKYLVFTGDKEIDDNSVLALLNLKKMLQNNKPNDKAKYNLPEAYKTELVWTINARSLQNFLSLRSDKSALWEIQQLAKEIFMQIPDEHKYLYKDNIKNIDAEALLEDIDFLTKD